MGIQHNKETKRWLLKAPMHMHYINELLTVFPDACIVQLHRDPIKIMASACSLIESVRQLWSPEVDLKVVGKDIYNELYMMLNHSIQSRKETGMKNIIDIKYDDLVQSPIATVNKIYQYFSYPMSEDFEENMLKHISDNPQHKHGVHSYSLEKYGLNEDEVKKEFEQLYEKAGIAII
ncbi:sulfotransferase [Pseudomonadota bacterium]